MAIAAEAAQGARPKSQCLDEPLCRNTILFLVDPAPGRLEPISLHNENRRVHVQALKCPEKHKIEPFERRRESGDRSARLEQGRIAVFG